jgi:tubulin monoglycylase TTLL3/8
VLLSKRAGSEQKLQFPLTSYTGKNIWLIKPINLNRGRCIKLHNKLNDIINDLNELKEKKLLTDDKNKKISRCEFVLVQKYIEKPLLYKNRKFDIRQWVLVTNINPLTLWMWEQPYLRFGAEDYKLTDINNLYSHLTNNSIAKYSEHFKETKIEGNMWEIPSFIEHMQTVYNKGDIWNDLHEKMKKIVISSFDSARHEMKQRENSFELFGYDFMIDEQFNVILIEVNSSPALDYSTKVTKKLVKLMIKDLIQVVIDNRDKLSQTKKIGEWTKIYQAQEVDSSYTPNAIGL